MNNNVEAWIFDYFNCCTTRINNSRWSYSLTSLLKTEEHLQLQKVIHKTIPSLVLLNFEYINWKDMNVFNYLLAIAPIVKGDIFQNLTVLGLFRFRSGLWVLPLQNSKWTWFNAFCTTDILFSSLMVKIINMLVKLMVLVMGVMTTDRITLRGRKTTALARVLLSPTAWIRAL